METSAWKGIAIVLSNGSARTNGTSTTVLTSSTRLTNARISVDFAPRNKHEWGRGDLSWRRYTSAKIYIGVDSTGAKRARESLWGNVG